MKQTVNQGLKKSAHVLHTNWEYHKAHTIGLCNIHPSARLNWEKRLSSGTLCR